MPFSETFVSARPGTVGLPKSGCLVGADGAFMVWVSENLYWQFMLLSGCAKCTSAGAHSKLTFRLARSSSRSGHGPLKTGARGDTHTGPVTLNPRWLRIQRAERGSHPIANTVNSIARKKGSGYFYVPVKGDQTRLVSTAILPCVALEYGQIPCAAWTSSSATSRSRP